MFSPALRNRRRIAAGTAVIFIGIGLWCAHHGPAWCGFTAGAALLALLLIKSRRLAWIAAAMLLGPALFAPRVARFDSGLLRAADSDTIAAAAQGAASGRRPRPFPKSSDRRRQFRRVPVSLRGRAPVGLELRPADRRRIPPPTRGGKRPRRNPAARAAGDHPVGLRPDCVPETPGTPAASQPAVQENAVLRARATHRAGGVSSPGHSPRRFRSRSITRARRSRLRRPSPSSPPSPPGKPWASGSPRPSIRSRNRAVAARCSSRWRRSSCSC